ncbi:hypothetical protein D3C87_1870450 [compost metagenome]
MLIAKRLYSIKRKVQLNGKGLFAPERAVIIERGNAFRHRHKVRGVGLGDFIDKSDNGLLGFAIVPGGKRISGLCADRGKRQYTSQ